MMYLVFYAIIDYAKDFPSFLGDADTSGIEFFLRWCGIV